MKYKIVHEKVYYIEYENGSRVGPFHDERFAESVASKSVDAGKQPPEAKK